MRILALETTDKSGGVAVLDGANVLASIDLAPQDRSARALAPAIHAIWRQVGWKPKDTQLIAVAVGPGSFTGLRVGIATAKSLAYALGAEVLGVNSLAVIASQLEQPAERVSVWMDAQRQQVFAGTFSFQPQQIPQWLAPASILDSDAAISQLLPSELVTGPALKKLSTHLPPAITVAPEALWHPTASGIGRLAGQCYSSGQRDDLWKMSPLYLRQSAAEEKWASQQ